MKSTKKALRLFSKNPFPIFSFIILLSISLSLMGLDHRKGIYRDIKEKSTFIIPPIIYIFNIPKNINNSLHNLFTSKSQLFKKNQELENKIIDLSIENQKLNLIEAENTQLRNSIRISKSLSIDSISADIILPNINNGKEIILINKGLKDGINIGNPVINNIGLIGQIITVGNNFSEINPITSKRYMVPAIFQKATDNVIIRGNGSGYLEVSMFPSHKEVSIGSVLMSSGIDNTYPKGIKIGKIIKITPKVNNQFNHLLIAPFSAPMAHSQVRVVIGKGK